MNHELSPFQGISAFQLPGLPAIRLIDINYNINFNLSAIFLNQTFIIILLPAGG